MNYRDYLKIKGLPYIYTQRADFKIIVAILQFKII